ncbi:MAG: hypothetical protein AABX89_00980 [Candidatus Thermoplasmatota archaeon]
MMPDVTGVVPMQRMSVARGTVTLDAAPSESQLAAAAAAANLAAKDAARIFPHLVPAQLTHLDCALDELGPKVTITMTVQGYARTSLASYALAGCSAALVSLAGDAGRIVEVHVVQNVEG